MPYKGWPMVIEYQTIYHYRQKEKQKEYNFTSQTTIKIEKSNTNQTYLRTKCKAKSLHSIISYLSLAFYQTLTVHFEHHHISHTIKNPAFAYPPTNTFQENTSLSSIFPNTYQALPRSPNLTNVLNKALPMLTEKIKLEDVNYLVMEKMKESKRRLLSN